MARAPRRRISEAELIRLCAECDAIERQHIALFHGPGRIEDDKQRDIAIKPLWRRQKPLLDKIFATQAQTVAGIRAKVATLVLWSPDIINYTFDAERVFIASVMQDLLRANVEQDVAA